MNPITDAMAWPTAAERIFGPLADALGLRPLRELGQACGEVATAQVEGWLARLQFGGVLASAAVDGAGRLSQQLTRVHEDGRAVDSPTALMRLALGELDGALHSAMLSEPGLAATAATVRATSRRRLGCQKLTALGAQAIGQPTRAEVDEAFREIQQLKRELRQLRRDVARATTERGTA